MIMSDTRIAKFRHRILSLDTRSLRGLFVFAVGCFFAVCPLICGAQPSSLPHLRKQGAATQLIVDGAPFLVLGGELGNSSSSSLEYMRPIWPKLAALNLNTVLVPVYWELIE